MSDFFRSLSAGVQEWASASALRYFVVSGACCADELFHLEACRYDLERFGAVRESDPRFCDLLFVVGAVNARAAEEVRRIHDLMADPKFVIAIGACACSGGVFSQAKGGLALPGVQGVVPVDIHVVGCPPRPEAIMDGLISLQRKIRGMTRSASTGRGRPERDEILDHDEWSRG